MTVLAFLAKQYELHASAFGGELHCVVDQIDNGLEQKIAVALHRRPIGSFGPKGDTLVLAVRAGQLEEALQEAKVCRRQYRA